MFAEVVVAALALAGRAGSADTLSIVEVRVVRAPEGRAMPATVVARRLAGPGAPGDRTPLEMEAPNGFAELRLDSGLWMLSARGPGMWGWPARLWVRPELPERSKMVLELWSTGRLTGQLRTPPSDITPAEIRVIPRRRFEPRASDTGNDDGFSIVCAVANLRWTCDVPVGQLDIEIHATPYMNRYLWSVSIQDDSTADGGVIILQRGASVAGWTKGVAGIPPSPPAVVELLSAGGESIPNLTAKANARGFFQIGPIPPGTYDVVARQDVLISHRTRVQVSAEKEERLSHPIVLQPPTTLAISVDPSLDPEGKPWRVRLLSVQGQRGQLVVRGESVSPAGEWSKPGLPAGPYRLAVTTASGDIWHEGALELDPGSERVALSLRMLHVTGTVTAGDQPLEARITLANEGRGTRATFQSDHAGRFQGIMPRREEDGGDWTASIDSADPLVRRHVDRVQVERIGDAQAHVDIRLAGGVIEGRVVDELGQPFARNAFVFAHNLDDHSDLGMVQTRLLSKDEGRFRLVGLAETDFRVYATAADDLQSDQVQARASVGRVPAKVTLVLRRSSSLMGRILSESGSPIAGAEVVAFAAETPFAMTRPAYTDAEGAFSLTVPPGAREMMLRVSAVGFTRRISRRPVPTRGELVVSLDVVGGTLVLAGFGDQVATGHGGGVLYVMHEGGFEAAPSLARWSALHGEVPRPDGLRVPQLAAGNYRVCRSASHEHAALVSGTLPQGRCAEGYLPPGGELRLTVPPAIGVRSSNE